MNLLQYLLPVGQQFAAQQRGRDIRGQRATQAQAQSMNLFATIQDMKNQQEEARLRQNQFGLQQAQEAREATEFKRKQEGRLTREELAEVGFKEALAKKTLSVTDADRITTGGGIQDFGKLYTPESIDLFNQSGKYSDLKPVPQKVPASVQITIFKSAIETGNPEAVNFALKSIGYDDPTIAQIIASGPAATKALLENAAIGAGIDLKVAETKLTAAKTTGEELYNQYYGMNMESIIADRLHKQGIADDKIALEQQKIAETQRKNIADAEIAWRKIIEGPRGADDQVKYDLMATNYVTRMTNTYLDALIGWDASTEEKEAALPLAQKMAMDSWYNDMVPRLQGPTPTTSTIPTTESPGPPLNAIENEPYSPLSPSRWQEYSRVSGGKLPGEINVPGVGSVPETGGVSVPVTKPKPAQTQPKPTYVMPEKYFKTNNYRTIAKGFLELGGGDPVKALGILKSQRGKDAFNKVYKGAKSNRERAMGYMITYFEKGIYGQSAAKAKR
jgi:hypothetical protein